MDAAKENYLRNIYFDPQKPASFSGVNKLYDYVKQEGEFNIRREEVEKWLQSQEVHTTNRLVKQNIKRRRVIVPNIDYMWDADVANLKDFSKQNNGIGYFLLVIDIMSRFVWCEPLKSPSGPNVKQAFINIFEEGRKPVNLRTDKGSEFNNELMQKLFKEGNINHFVTQNEVKANYAERAIQTVKGKIMRYLRAKQSHKWSDQLGNVTFSYNNTVHRSIKQKPASVTKEDENRLWKHLYLKNHPLPNKKKKKFFKFNIGEVVRISRLRHPFQRYYSDHWTTEFFYIHTRDFKQFIPAYTLKDYFGDPITGMFYEPELQRIYVDENTVYKIEKIEDTRTVRRKKESQIKWMGWPKKFNSWIPSSEVKDYK